LVGYNDAYFFSFYFLEVLAPGYKVLDGRNNPILCCALLLNAASFNGREFMIFGESWFNK
jgi:hypothetical protein